MIALKPGPKRYHSSPRREQRGAQVANAKSRPAPVGGWNARDPVDSMQPTDAVQLDNWFPRQADVITRPGYEEWCDTGTGEPVGRIMRYEYGATNKILASSDGGVYDVTTSSPSTLDTGFTSDQWVDSALNGLLFLANGADTMQKYNGSTLVDATFTGVTLANISYVHTYKQRVYLVEKNTQKFWYGGVQAVSGAVSAFDLSLVERFDGALLAAFTVSHDAGNGPADYLALLFDSGDGIIYSGSDPSDADNWQKVGRFKVGRPVSKFAVLHYDSDIIVVTERGYESVKVALQFKDSLMQQKLISDKIQQAVSSKLSQRVESDYWGIAVYNLGQMLIINVPNATTSEQHVRNINTGAWCRFLDINATCWAGAVSDVYFGTEDGRVCKFGTLNNDNGASIRCDALTAWDYFGDREHIKQHTMQRPIFTTPKLPTIYVSMGVDFQEVPVGSAIAPSRAVSTSYWDTATWDVDSWGAASSQWQDWLGIGVTGHASAMRIALDASEEQVAWNTTLYVFQRGSYI